MLIIAKYIAKLLKALASEAKPWQLALGFVFGMFLGLTPLFSLHNLLFVILILMLKVNLGMAVLGFGVFSGIAYLLDPVFHQLGKAILTNEGMRETFTAMYNNEWWALTRFYNTIVMGSLISSLLLSGPMYPFAIWFVGFYRKTILPRVQKLKIVQVLKGTKVYQLYERFSGVGDHL